VKSKKKIKRKRISLARRILYSFIAVVVVLGFLEVTFRLLGAKPFPVTPYADSGREMEWELKPNFSGEWVGVKVETNSMGFRDGEISLKKKPNEFRILFLGDSVVFGYKLRQEDTIPEQLEHCLNQQYPQRYFNVINAGVDGYSTYHELYLLKYKGLQLKPDLVIVGFVLNDVYEQYRTTAHYGGAAGYADAGRKSLRRTIVRLCHKSALFTSLQLAYLKIEGKRRERLQTLGKWRYRSLDSVYEIAEIFKEPYSPEIEAAWADTLEQLARLKALAAENGIPVLVVLFPYAYQLEATELALKPQGMLIPFCKKERIAFYDLLPTFLKRADMPAPLRTAERDGDGKAGAEGLFLDGNHFNAEGSEFIARTLCERLSQRNAVFLRGNRFTDAFRADASMEAYKVKGKRTGEKRKNGGRARATSE
jgi:lysophospholipase L1-like esterase